MSEIKPLYDYNTDLEYVVNYDEDYPNLRKVNIYNYIKKLDESLKIYLSDVQKVIDIEKNYGLNKSAIQIDDTSVTVELVKNIEETAKDLEKRWELIKIKIEKAVLKDRIDILEKIIKSCKENIAPGSYLIDWAGMASEEDSKRMRKAEEAQGYLDYSKQRLDKLD